MNKQVDECEEFEKSVGEPNIDVLLRGWERMLEFEEEVRTGKRVIAAHTLASPKRGERAFRGGAQKRITAGAGGGNGS